MKLFTPLRLRGTEFKIESLSHQCASTPLRTDIPVRGTWCILEAAPWAEQRWLWAKPLQCKRSAGFRPVILVFIWIHTPRHGVRLSSSSMHKARWLEFNWLTRGEREVRPRHGSVVLP